MSWLARRSAQDRSNTLRPVGNPFGLQHAALLGLSPPALFASPAQQDQRHDQHDQRQDGDLQRVWSLTMTFMPMTEGSNVIGSVSTAMTARRSAAMVIFVSRELTDCLSPAASATGTPAHERCNPACTAGLLHRADRLAQFLGEMTRSGDGAHLLHSRWPVSQMVEASSWVGRTAGQPEQHAREPRGHDQLWRDRCHPDDRSF